MKCARRLCAPTLILVLTSLGLTAQARAQQPSEAQISAIRASCASDYRSHCASVPTGGMPALNCLRQNVSKLSAACQTAVKAVGGGAASPSAAPAAPPAAPSASPAEAAPEAPAAPAARAIPPMSPRQEIAVLRGACGPDYRALCGGVPPGGGRVIACLRENAPSLSARCKAVLMAARRR
ncbi:MAG: hypothetical protein JO172_14095 [Hyphomicrobiales bacterium]|nr:hypothetical protein [Hyphomicrobiales bacterium]